MSPCLYALHTAISDQFVLLHTDSTGVVDAVKKNAVTAEVLVDGPSRALTMAIVVDDEYPSDRQARVEVLEFMPSGLIPVRIEA